MSLLKDNQCIEEDTISEITIDENDFDKSSFLYYQGHIVKNIYIKLECSNEKEKYIYVSKINKCRYISIEITEKDKNITDAISKLFFIHFPVTIYHTNEKISRTIFKNYINLIKDEFILKNGIVRIKLQFGMWIKNYYCQKYSFFWLKCKKSGKDEK